MSRIYKNLVMASLFNEACTLQVTIVPTSPHCLKPPHTSLPLCLISFSPHSIFPFFLPSIHPSILPSTHLSIHPSIHPSIHLTILPSIFPFFFPFFLPPFLLSLPRSLCLHASFILPPFMAQPIQLYNPVCYHLFCKGFPACPLSLLPS